MLSQYYQKQLGVLRELAVEFSKKHPALAPMLSGKSPDPDVERLLEGTAFLSGLMEQRLDDEFPEIVHSLLRLIFPHYLRPIPSMTILAFSPKKALRETLAVPAGVQAASIPVGETSCLFTTSCPVELHPMTLGEAALVPGGQGAARLVLRFDMQGPTLEAFKADSLRLHLTGDFAQAADRLRLVFDKTRSVTIRPKDGAPVALGAGAVKMVGFSAEESTLPYPSQSFPGYRIIQEYFILPEKFLFFEVTGLSAWKTRKGSSFELVFDMPDAGADLPSVKTEDFALYCTPAVNLFPHEAEPILLDHRLPEYRVIPSGGAAGGYAVYAVERVTGSARGGAKEREYAPFELFNPQAEAGPVYAVHQRLSPLGGEPEIHLSAAYPPGEPVPGVETLSIQITCTNGSLPESLQLGDVSKPTESSPVLADFRNIRPTTAVRKPPLGKDGLWRLLSHIFINYLSLASADNLRSLLKLYVFEDTLDRAAVLAAHKRIDAVANFTVKRETRLVGGVLMRGQTLDLTLDPAGFAGPGDQRLFASILDYFLAGYAAVNCYTRLVETDVLNKERRTWPTRIGERFLL